MRILAIDTSAAVSVCIHDGDEVLAEAHVVDPRRHAELLAPMVTEALARADVDRSELTHIAVGVGPGPFTGLRVGIVTAEVLGLALGLPVHGVCSLDALAEEAAGDMDDGAEFVVATDARRREVYWARYGIVGAEAVRYEGPNVGPAGDIQVDDITVVGRGTTLYPEVLAGRLDNSPDVCPDDLLDPRATFIAEIVADALHANEPARLLPLEPLYLRRPDAVEPRGPKKVVPSGR